MVLAIDVAMEDFVAAIFCNNALVTTIKWTHPHETAQLLAGISQRAQRGRFTRGGDGAKRQVR